MIKVLFSEALQRQLDTERVDIYQLPSDMNELMCHLAEYGDNWSSLLTNKELEVQVNGTPALGNLTLKDGDTVTFFNFQSV